jgi:hypothetical protein
MLTGQVDLCSCPLLTALGFFLMRRCEAGVTQLLVRNQSYGSVACYTWSQTYQVSVAHREAILPLISLASTLPPERQLML